MSRGASPRLESCIGKGMLIAMLQGKCARGGMVSIIISTNASSSSAAWRHSSPGPCRPCPSPYFCRHRQRPPVARAPRTRRGEGQGAWWRRIARLSALLHPSSPIGEGGAPSAHTDLAVQLLRGGQPLHRVLVEIWPVGHRRDERQQHPRCVHHQHEVVALAHVANHQREQHEREHDALVELLAELLPLEVHGRGRRGAARRARRSAGFSLVRARAHAHRRASGRPRRACGRARARSLVRRWRDGRRTRARCAAAAPGAAVSAPTPTAAAIKTHSACAAHAN